MFLLNLHNPNSKPPGIDVWRSRLADFIKHPVPRTKEEAKARKLEEVVEWRDRIKEETHIRVMKAKPKFRSLPAPKPFLFNWRKFMWNSNKGTNMLPI